MSEKYDVNYLEVGDTFDGGPIEQGYFISAVMAVGGEIEIDGNVVTILQLPKSEAKAPESVVEEAPEDVVGGALITEVKEADPEVAIAPEPKPKSSPKPKTTPAPEAKE